MPCSKRALNEPTGIEVHTRARGGRIRSKTAGRGYFEALSRPKDRDDKRAGLLQFFYKPILSPLPFGLRCLLTSHVRVVLSRVNAKMPP